jgi:hypothetical protein
MGKGMEKVYIFGWKEIARFIGYHPDYIRSRHHSVQRLAYQKSYPSKQGRVIVDISTLTEWARKVFPNLTIRQLEVS